MNADELRSTFTGFYAARQHAVVPSASLIPHDPTVLFTIAGMVPFKPYFAGDEAPPWPRATSVQKCFRTVDIDIIGTTVRHFTVYESDDEAADLWTGTVGVPADRVQRMGEDNFWTMGGTGQGPCGPSSELYYNRGERFGAGGGPALGGEERYVEL